MHKLLINERGVNKQELLDFSSWKSERAHLTLFQINIQWTFLEKGGKMHFFFTALNLSNVDISVNKSIIVYKSNESSYSYLVLVDVITFLYYQWYIINSFGAYSQRPLNK